MKTHSLPRPFPSIAVTFVVLILGAATLSGQSADAAGGRDRSSYVARNAVSLLEETELRVLSQHYEKSLGAFYETQLELQLRERGEAGESREQRAAELERLSTRAKVLAEWTEQLRARIQDKVNRLNELEKLEAMRRRGETDPAPPPAPAKPGPQPKTGSASDPKPPPQI